MRSLILNIVSLLLPPSVEAGVGWNASHSGQKTTSHPSSGRHCSYRRTTARAPCSINPSVMGILSSVWHGRRTAKTSRHFEFLPVREKKPVKFNPVSSIVPRLQTRLLNNNNILQNQYQSNDRCPHSRRLGTKAFIEGYATVLSCVAYLACIN